jgi:hypothetical protein
MSDDATKRTTRRQLIRGDNQQIVPFDGAVHPKVIAEDLCAATNRGKWVSVGELARLYTGRNLEANRVRVRRQLTNVFSALILVGEFLLYETTRRGEIIRVKLFSSGSEAERRLAQAQLAKMHHRKLVTDEKFALATDILEKAS